MIQNGKHQDANVKDAARNNGGCLDMAVRKLAVGNHVNSGEAAKEEEMGRNDKITIEIIQRSSGHIDVVLWLPQFDYGLTHPFLENMADIDQAKRYAKKMQKCLTKGKPEVIMKSL